MLLLFLHSIHIFGNQNKEGFSKWPNYQLQSKFEYYKYSIKSINKVYKYI